MSEKLLDIYNEEIGTIIEKTGDIVKVRMKQGYMDPNFIENDDHLEVIYNNVEVKYNIFSHTKIDKDIILTLEKVPEIRPNI